MDNDEISSVVAQIEFDRIAELQKNKEEFDKLGSSHFGLTGFLAIIAPFALLIVINSVFTIEAELLKILYVIIFVSSLVQSIVIAQSRKTNRRIDLLFKIIKQEQSNNT